MIKQAKWYMEINFFLISYKIGPIPNRPILE